MLFDSSLRRDLSRSFGATLVVILTIVMGVGMSWSHVQRRLSGQLDVDDLHQS